ncbi:reverse transcriptase domain-containing protein [Tanacetum coccineum]
MFGTFMKMNTASTSGSGPLPSNTVANPRGDVKAITTRNGVSYKGPPVPPPTFSLPKVVEREPKVTTDTLDECLALADLGASINLMPLSIWKKLSLLELTPTQMILELADRSTTRPAGITEDVFVKVGKFHFPTDFVVVDYVVDPQVPLILERPFLRTRRALIDVYGEELTLGHDDEAVTFKVGQTSSFYYNDDESINRIDVIDVACEEYAQEVLGFLEIYASGNSHFKTDYFYLFSHSHSLRGYDELPKLELKYLPSHLEYTFLEGTDKLPVIMAKDLKDEEKDRLLEVLKSHKRAID